MGSSIPSNEFPNYEIFSYDKLLHFGVFTGLALLTYRAFRHQDRFPTLANQALLWTLVLTTAYGALDEIHQFLVPGRTPDIFDWLADSTGVAIALLLALEWRKRMAARK